MPPISILIKPASSNCNMRCGYCFYHDLAQTREVGSYGIMNRDTLETVVKKAFDYADTACTFAFQGGEPTLAGLDFYKTLLELEKKYNYKKIQINNAIQTNGISINEEWVAFLAHNQFLTGVSLDGTRDIHDALRPDTASKGTFNRVLRAVNLFKRFGAEYNILTVVSSYVARNTKKVYDFFRNNDFDYLQFIPCLDPLGDKPGGNEYSLTPEDYLSFLKTLFDLWYEDFIGGRAISIRYFDNLVGMLMGYPPESCGMSGRCTCYFVAEADGGIYPCDFYVTDEWRLGSILESDLEMLSNTDIAKRFVEASKPVDQDCKSCRWYSLCRGGCRRNREPFENGMPMLNYYCPAFKGFFEYAGERLRNIAGMLVHKNS